MSIKALLAIVVYGVFVILLLSGILHWLIPYNSTDNIATGERSGMSLYTDNQTGCQYLKAGLFGGITPRIGGDGDHLGCR